MARITVTTEKKRERVTSQSAIRRPRDCSAAAPLSVVPKWIAVHTGEVATAEAVERDVQIRHLRGYDNTTYLKCYF